MSTIERKSSLDLLDLLKTIALTKELNPFSNSFSEIKLKEFIDNDYPDIDINFIKFILENSLSFKNFSIFCNKIKSNTDIFDYYLLAITYTNHDWMELQKLTTKQLEQIQKNNNGIHTSLDSQKIKITTPLSDFSFGSFSDGLTETLDFIFSTLNSITSLSSMNISLKEDYILTNNDFIKLQFYSQEFVMIKGYFEQICLVGAIFNRKDENTYQILNTTIPDYLLYRQIGYERIEQNISMRVQELYPIIKINAFLGKKRIDQIYLNSNDDEVCIKYTSKIKDDSLLKGYYLVVLSSIYNYHTHLGSNFINRILKIGEIYSILLYFVNQFIDFNISTFEGNNYENQLIPFSKYQYKISEKTLLTLIKNISDFNHEEIILLLKHFINYGSESFWHKPLLKIGNYYFIDIHSLNTVCVPYLIDTWVKEEFKNYDTKGKSFEKFLKNEITRLCDKRNFTSKIIQRQNFKITIPFTKTKIKEEIDFIWETKNLIIIAEVKCMNYPFTNTIAYNNLKTLQKASEQIIRKTKFLTDNKLAFPELSLDKKILNCIITNYPCFSGIKINDIPVLDIGLFENYINVGGIGDKEISNYYSITHMKKVYYNNDDEFSKNLEILINNSPYLNQLKQHYKKYTHEIEIFNNKKIIYDSFENIDF